MEKILEKSLTLLGCSSLEIKFFIACFTIGPASITQIAAGAKIRRSTAYLLAKKLIADGLILEDHKTYGGRLHTIEPKRLLQIVADRQRRFRRLEIEIEENLPDLQALYKASDIRPKVRLYEGNSGLMQIWNDILSTKGEILLWTNQQTENLFFGPQSHDQFISERVRKNIPIRVLAVNNLSGSELRKKDKSVLRQTKLLPEKTVFSAETYIYDSKIAMLDYNQDTIGIIVESQALVTQQKAQFELVWNFIK